MRCIVIANKKGGVGKTTTTQNVACTLAACGKKVLAVDMDAQANLTRAWGVAMNTRKTVLDVLRGKATWQEIAIPVERDSGSGGCVLLAPANRQLAAMPEVFADEIGKECLLKEALQAVTNVFDYVLVDSPPSLDLQVINTYVAADAVLVPVQCEFHSLEGLSLIKDDLERVRKRLNPGLRILGIVPTFVDKRKRLCRDVLAVLQEKYADDLLQTIIRDNVALAEAPSHGKSIFAYDSKSHGAKDYALLGSEVQKRLEVLNVA